MKENYKKNLKSGRVTGKIATSEKTPHIYILKKIGCKSRRIRKKDGLLQERTEERFEVSYYTCFEKKDI